MGTTIWDLGFRSSIFSQSRTRCMQWNKSFSVSEMSGPGQLWSCLQQAKRGGAFPMAAAAHNNVIGL